MLSTWSSSDVADTVMWDFCVLNIHLYPILSDESHLWLAENHDV